MNVKEAIYVRSSVRCFSDANISRDVIIEMLNIARFVPSSKNAQHGEL